jgi:hypothetical protein
MIDERAGEPFLPTWTGSFLIMIWGLPADASRNPLFPKLVESHFVHIYEVTCEGVRAIVVGFWEFDSQIQTLRTYETLS